ncbi:hypothetical protein ACF3NG_06685 [Aerococcaceae bacterium WGS1372]
MKYMETIQQLLNSNRTSYSIAKDTGLSPQYVDNYRSGKSKLENMALGKAEILVEYKSKLEEIEMIKNMTIEEFYMLDEVSVESDGFYYVDDENDINEMVPTPEEAFLPEDEWDGEDYSDHLHPAYLPAWEELKDKVAEAYEQN